MAYPRGKPRPHTNLGRPHSLDTRKKISESCKKVGMGKWNKGKNWTPEQCEHKSKALKKFYQTPKAT